MKKNFTRWKRRPSLYNGKGQRGIGNSYSDSTLSAVYLQTPSLRYTGVLHACFGDSFDISVSQAHTQELTQWLYESNSEK